MKSEEQIREEISKHKKAIIHKFNERTLDEKLHSCIIEALEWVLK